MSEAYPLNYRTTTTSILTRRGKRETLLQPLISPFGKPNGGWYVNILVKDIPHGVTGKTAAKVFTAVKKMLQANDVQASDLDIWYNLNVQWFDRTHAKYLLISKTALLSVAVKVGDKATFSENPSARRYTPALWGAFAWDFMGILLAKDDYIWDDFVIVVLQIQKMLNKDQNPSIGCNDCYIEFTKAVELLRKNPLYTADGARNWLVDFHNSVNIRLNKPVFTFEAAAKKYLWL